MEAKYSETNMPKDQLEQTNALKVLVKALDLAAKRGAFNIQESKIIADAIDVFTDKSEKTTTELDKTEPTTGAVNEPKIVKKSSKKKK